MLLRRVTATVCFAQMGQHSAIEHARRKRLTALLRVALVPAAVMRTGTHRRTTHRRRSAVETTRRSPSHGSAQRSVQPTDMRGGSKD